MIHPATLSAFRSTAVLTLTALALNAQSNPAHSCTLLGGNGSQEYAQSVVVASNGDLIIAGRTDSTDLPGTAGSFDDTYNGSGDAFVARLSGDGTQLLAATYLGGSFPDEAVFVHEAPNGEIWVGGTTQSSNFPTTPNAFAAHNGNTRQDAFLARFDANLTTMPYCTAFGSPGRDYGEAFAVDDQNQLVYLSGRTVLLTSHVPVTPTAFQSQSTGGSGIYLAVLDVSSPASTTLHYGTLLDGSGDEREAGGLSVAANGIVTVSGRTNSTDFPVTAGAVQSTGGGFNESGVVIRIDTQASGAAGLLYGTYIGGSGSEPGIRHAVQPGGVVHVLLESSSPNLPLTPNALLTTNGGNTDLYYAQIDPAQSGAAGLVFGSWILNVGSSKAAGIAFAAGKVAMFGETTSFGQLATPGAFMASAHGNGHGYILELDVSSGPNPFVSYASHYAGCPVPGSSVRPGAMIYDGNEVVLAGGASFLPFTPGGFQMQAASNLDAFVGRLDVAPWPAVTSFGTACAGSAGTPQLTATSAPRICYTMGIQGSGLPSNGVGLFFAGFDRTQFQSTPLPFSLAAIGAPGCEVLVAPQALIFKVADSTGTVSQSISIPHAPDFVGLPIYAQFASIDAPANPLGMTTTNALAAYVRW